MSQSLAGEQTNTYTVAPSNRQRKDWMKEAKCTPYPALFTSDETPKSVKGCKAICGDCPVIAECLGYALAHDIPGIWAGTNSSQRKAMKVNRPLLAAAVPLEPDFADYLKLDEEPKKPVMTQKPKKVVIPPASKAPKVIEKKPLHQSGWDALGQALHDLQSSSWLAKPA